MRLFTVLEVAGMLAVCPNVVYGWCRAGVLSHYRLGLGRGKIAIAEHDVQAFLDSRRVQAKEAEPRQAPPPPKPAVKLKHLRLTLS